MKLLTNGLSDSDFGVSPVVATILLIAVTVILASIAATFVFRIGGRSTNEPTARVDITQLSDSDGDGVGSYMVRVQVIAMENANYVTVDGPGTLTGGVDSDGDGSQDDVSTVGERITMHDLSLGDKVTITATLEGRTRVMQTFEVTN